MMINYPFSKIVCNRAFHVFVKVLLLHKVRDVSNNLKLYRAEILKDLQIEERHFAANAETGLKPLLAGYNIKEVPISWINRTMDMGTSSFKIVKVAPNYLLALVRTIWRTYRSRVSDQEKHQCGASVSNMQCPLCSHSALETYADSPRRELTASMIGSSRKEVAAGPILRCMSCGFGFRPDRSSDSELAALYRDVNIDVYQSELRGRTATAGRRLRVVQQHCPIGRLLDVGCASGLFLQSAADAGWSVVGVEPSEALSVLAQKNLGSRGEVIAATLQDSGLNHPTFDVVTLWDVLEHVTNPREFLASCAALVKPGGYLFVNVPDLGSLQARVLGRRWPLILPEHLNYFTRRSLTFCAEYAGLAALQTGRLKASFSLDYVFYRLRQHRVIGAELIGRLADRLGVGRVVIPVSLGEVYAVCLRKKPAASTAVA
jgi:SAM-dependent methyltransferase